MSLQHTTDSTFNVALNNCDREPVHVPGRIQTFASLIAFDIETTEIVFLSEDLLHEFPPPPPDDQFTPRRFPSLQDFIVDRTILHAIRGALGLPTIRAQRERLGVFLFREHAYDFALHIVNSYGVLEIENVDEIVERPGTAIARVRSMLGSLKFAEGQQTLLDGAVLLLRKLTGFDRVMGYKFLDDGSGEVLSEALSPSLAAFKGLRYPAYDIPQQVRHIALVMPIRVIADVDGVDRRIIAGQIESLSQQPLIDLTLAHSRGVSSIHLEYLKNMGVRASMSISIIIHGKLWGLFAFHHGRPKKLSPDYRSIAELFSQLFSMHLQQESEKEIISKRRRIDSIDSLLRERRSDGTAASGILTVGEEILKMFNANGIALIRSNQITTHGSTPSREVITTIRDRPSDELTAIDNLRNYVQASQGDGIEALKEMPDCKSGGTLKIKLDDSSAELMIFRDEIIHEIRWGGLPEKRITYGSHGPRLHPRSSFDEYRETVAGKCEPWTQSDIAAITELRNVLVRQLNRDIQRTSVDAEDQKRHRDLLIAELNHRVKNILALVQSIAQQTKTTSTTLKEYTETFEQRLGSLVAAHELVGSSGVQWVTLRRIFRIELLAYLRERYDVMLEGEEVSVRSDVAPTLVLVIHELVTNAVKHGVLSDGHGKLMVRWFEEAGGLKIVWHESDRPRDDKIIEPGFGLALIQRAIPHECEGEAEINFRSDGLTVEFWLPQPLVRKELAAASDTAQEAVTVTKTSQKRYGSILILEDNLILAMELERVLKQHGVSYVDTTSTIEHALKSIDDHKFDLAILDINVEGSPSFPVAQRLRDIDVPFIFVSGYDKDFSVPDSLADATRLGKPVRQRELLNALDALIPDQPT